MASPSSRKKPIISVRAVTKIEDATAGSTPTITCSCLPAMMMLATTGLVLLTVGLAVFAEPTWELCEAAARELVGPRRSYLKAVLGR